MSRTTYWRRFKRAVIRAGLMGKGYTVHSLRKAYAVNLWRRHHSLEVVRAALNHDRPTTTMVYLVAAFEQLAREESRHETVSGMLQ